MLTMVISSILFAGSAQGTEGPYVAPGLDMDLSGLPAPTLGPEGYCMPGVLAKRIQKIWKGCAALPGQCQERLDWIRRIHATDLAGAVDTARKEGRQEAQEAAASGSRLPVLQVAVAIVGAGLLGVGLGAAGGRWVW